MNFKMIKKLVLNCALHFDYFIIYMKNIYKN